MNPDNVPPYPEQQPLPGPQPPQPEQPPQPQNQPPAFQPPQFNAPAPAAPPAAAPSAQPAPTPSAAPTPENKYNNPLDTMRDGEQNICQIRRHPIGMVGMYLACGFVVLIIAILAYGVAPHILTNYSKSQVAEIGTLILLSVAVVMAAYLFIAHIVYWGNRWILTTDSLTQVQQHSLFDKQSSQLSLGNLEDVTALQNGILAHMFNFGVLRAETAGERSHFVFMFCPNPTHYAQEILRAREDFEQGRRVASFGNQDLNHFATPMSEPDSGVNVDTE